MARYYFKRLTIYQNLCAAPQMRHLLALEAGRDQLRGWSELKSQFRCLVNGVIRWKRIGTYFLFLSGSLRGYFKDRSNRVCNKLKTEKMNQQTDCLLDVCICCRM